MDDPLDGPLGNLLPEQGLDLLRCLGKTVIYGQQATSFTQSRADVLGALSTGNIIWIQTGSAFPAVVVRTLEP